MPRAEVCRRRMRDAIAFADDSRPLSCGNSAATTLKCAPASVKWPVARISGTLVPTERATKTISPRDYGPSERERRLLLLWPTMSQMGHSRRLSDVGMSASPPDYGRITATQRTDALGQHETFNRNGADSEVRIEAWYCSRHSGPTNIYRPNHRGGMPSNCGSELISLTHDCCERTNPCWRGTNSLRWRKAPTRTA